MDSVDSIIEDVSKECHDDYVGLWVIVRRLRDMGVEEGSIRETTLGIVRRLLDMENIVAGNFNTQIDEDFHEWQMSIEDTITIIAREWQTLGRDPNIGDIVWFTSKDEQQKH